MRQNPLDYRWVFNAGNDLDLPGAPLTGLNINIEHAFEPLHPGHRLVALGWRFALTVHRCNDMVVDSSGRAYVGNFGFDPEAEFAAANGAPDYANLPTTNLIRVDPDGTVQVASAQMHFPNGSVISADGQTLIIAESTAGCLTAFTIASDGTLYDRRLWARLDGVAPDGICLDARGRVWVANAFGAECLLIAEGGRIVQRVETSQPCFACMLGGADGRTLFALTAADSDAAAASRQRSGKIEVLLVEHQRAGWP